MKEKPTPLRAAFLASLAAWLLTGCASLHIHRTGTKPVAAIPATFTPTPVAAMEPLDPALLQRPNLEYRLGPGDMLQIEIIGDLTTRTRAVVGPDGKIYFNL